MIQAADIILEAFESPAWIMRVFLILVVVGFPVTLIGVFASHLMHLRLLRRESGKSWIRFIFDPEGMMITPRDLRQFWQSLKWFLGIGPRPRFGRWTYWEKFDYFAVFWGVFIIGSTGLILWFPELFTRV
ncbi:MAG: hypothetical protein ACE5E8_11910, partial [Acidimicrobiia bacterium]